jgi:hypothetical protein
MPYKSKDQQREYQRNWIAAKRADFFANKVCVDCEGIDQLELDHRDPKEKVSHRIWSWSMIRIAEETAKCVVRCHKCHVLKTTDNKERARGEASGTAKLTLIQVTTIRMLFSTGEYTKRRLARQFNVDEKNIRMILANKTWKQ